MSKDPDLVLFNFSSSPSAQCAPLGVRTDSTKWHSLADLSVLRPFHCESSINELLHYPINKQDKYIEHRILINQKKLNKPSPRFMCVAVLTAALVLFLSSKELADGM